MNLQPVVRDMFTERLKRAGGSITRHNYIAVKYDGRPPRPWTHRHEASLPTPFRRT